MTTPKPLTLETWAALDAAASPGPWAHDGAGLISTGEYFRDGVHTNSIESVWAVLKRGIHGIWPARAFNNAWSDAIYQPRAALCSLLDLLGVRPPDDLLQVPVPD